MQPDLRKRGLGLILFVAVLLIVGSLLQHFQIDRAIQREHTALVERERAIGTLEVALADLRTAQTAYLAIGQGPEVWMPRASELAQRLEGSLTELSSSTAIAQARPRRVGRDHAGARLVLLLAAR
jgi:hypothetical protein